MSIALTENARLGKRLSAKPSSERSESVYYAARGLCLREVDHLEDLAQKLGVPLNP
ncbi:MAG: hypothetical protein OXE95_07845 [Chloroflexi bacterium]|nr:hypothetical protein [Chloroflexota bacterium]MCY4247469.1 hypothetical protein [Chloroflexota bacterium]